MRKMIIIGCVKTKRRLADGETVPAAELYTSPLFKKRLRLAESTGDPVRILSAEHGLLHTQTPIAGYDTTIAAVKSIRHGASSWHKQTAATLDAFAGEERTIRVEVHAGAAYVQRLADAAALCKVAVIIETPMKGMQIGEQLRHYNNIHASFEAAAEIEAVEAVEAADGAGDEVDAAVILFETRSRLGVHADPQGALMATLARILTCAPLVELVAVGINRGAYIPQFIRRPEIVQHIFIHILAALGLSPRAPQMYPT